MTDFDQLLTLTSRTFGLSIPLLDEPHRRRLTLAYLLFRVADTIEDAERIPRSQRVRALHELRETILTADQPHAAALASQWLDWELTEHKGYLMLLRELPALLESVQQLGEPAHQFVVQYVCRTIEGMASFIERAEPDGAVRLHSLDELRQYCYVVAGIVGELITELFVAYRPCLAPVEAVLREHAALFGEGLQLVNILKDADDDADAGRTFLPVSTSSDAVFQLAREDLRHADQYCAALARCNPGQGILAFIELPIRLAHGTLDRVQHSGAGAKLTRGEIAGILRDVTR
jgi:farnesyl-diphosphate farnesyltransferase